MGERFGPGGGTLAEQQAAWRSRFHDVEATEVVASGHPAAVLREHAADADMVVISDRGHGEVSGMLLGSIARSGAASRRPSDAVVRQPP